MSYCRFSDADVYVYDDVRGYLCCCGCWLDDTWRYDTAAEMVEHLRLHIAAGHHVPDHVIPEILADAVLDDPARAARRIDSLRAIGDGGGT